MKNLLRSCFVGGHTDDSELAFRNYMALAAAGLDFDVQGDTLLWTFIGDFARTHNHVPDVRTLRSHFESIRQNEAVDRLSLLEVLRPIYKGDFIKRLEERAEERRTRQVLELLREAAQVVQTGVEIKEGKNSRILKGPIDAVRFLMDRSHDIVTPTGGARLSGEITMDGADFQARYERIKSDPLAGIGQFTGIEQLDSALKGAKKFELWTHAAFTGGLKSTFALNWAYNQAVYMKHDVCFFSLEMPYEQCRNLLYAMHSLHGKFREERIASGVQKSPGPNVGIDYENIRDGLLTPQEEAFLFGSVVPDLNSNEYGKLHIEVGDPDKIDYTVADLRSKAELIYSRSPFSMVVVDHAGLLASRKFVPSTTDRINEVIRDLKKMAMSFNRGAGIAVVVLFQISREGFKAAEKIAEKSNGAYGIGPYNLTHLSYANECTVKGTFLPTRRGLVTVEKVLVGDSVWSRSGWKKVLATFDQGVRKVYRLKTDRGAELRATGNHRVRVADNSGVRWAAVDSLKPGDYLLTPGSGWKGGERKKLPPLEVRKSERSRNRDGKPLVAPRFANRDLAYLLGAWDGDGVDSEGGVKWCGNSRELAVQTRLQNSFYKVFGEPLKHHVDGGSFLVAKYSQALARWWAQVAGPRALQVPECILQGTKALRASYLRGLFDTDGWVNNQGNVGINLKGSCTSYLQTVQMLLASLGIDSRLGHGTERLEPGGREFPFVSLGIRCRYGRELFSKLVGFTEPLKTARLRTFVRARRGSTKRATMERVPYVGAFLEGLRAVVAAGGWKGLPAGFCNLPEQTVRRGYVPLGSALALVRAARERGVPLPEEFLELDTVRLVRVESVTEELEPQPVYDLEVGGDHEYQTGPVFSHNCERSSDIVTAGYIDKDLRAQNRLLFQCLKTRDMKGFENFFARVDWKTRRLLTSHDVVMVGGGQPGGGRVMPATLDEITALT